MQTLRGWSAKRSGANIRVTGFDTSTQQDVKITATSIEPRRGGLVIAETKEGEVSLVVE